MTVKYIAFSYGDDVHVVTRVGYNTGRQGC